jgi:hypothetical protein
MDHPPLDYDHCAQFLARLDADALHAHHDNPHSLDTLDTEHLSPFDIDSASPPGLSSGSATSHSPESLRYEWDPTDNSFFDLNDDGTGGIIPGGSNTPWEISMLADQTEPGLSPMSDYIKIENENSPSGYYSEPAGPQRTISPGNSLIDPTARTALEDGYSFKDNEVFDYASFTQQQQNNTRPSSTDQFGPMMWRNQPQREDFPPNNWQQQQQQSQQQVPQQQQLLEQLHQQTPQQLQQQLQRVQQQQQQQQQQLQQQQQQQQQQVQHIVQQSSPLRKSVSPPCSHTSPESQIGSNENSDDGAAPSAPRSKKRKTSSDAEAGEATETTGGRKQPKKTAHNMIEKRYRTNLNDKIAALRESVPSLRVMAGTARLGEDDEEEDLGGLAPAHKLNKATVLAKATEYIRYLEKKNKRLQDENDQLKNRLNAFEKLATMGGSMGLHHQSQHGGRGGQAGGPGGGGMMSRLMVGSLAGLMIANGLQSNDDGSRQLAAAPFPVDFLGFAGPAANNHAFWLISKLLLLFTAVIYVISPSFFDAKDLSENAKPTNNSHVATAPSLASPLKDRSHAWLTAIQTVWVPRHSVTLELIALALKAIKLSLRRMIGWEKYRMLTGMTEEQELARIKSWAIALDAQLTGGDLTVNHSRLLLTLLASWTLPATPTRTMLNALHIRLLFFDLGAGFQAFSEPFSNYYWGEARKAQEKAVAENDIEQQLSENLAQLLQLEPSDVFDDRIVHRAFNLCYNRDAHDGLDEGMDSVVRDVSIRSPLDALAAWYSSLLLRKVFVSCLKAKPSPASSKGIQSDLETALRIAPPNSAAHIRALTASAVLSEEHGQKYLSEAMQIFEEDFRSHEREINAKGGSPSMVPVTPLNSAVTTTNDIRIALRCSMALWLMKTGSRAEATRLFTALDWKQQQRYDRLGLLGFVSAWKTVTMFTEWDADWAKDAGQAVDDAAGMMRLWIGDKRIPKFEVTRTDCMRIIDFCCGLQKKLAGLGGDEDDGYVSADHKETEGALVGVEVERVKA